MNDDTNLEERPRRLAKRTQLILVAVGFTILIGFCAVPCVIFGGWTSIEQFFTSPPPPPTSP